tara:strand:+ start:3945 stop:4154 length:210 start_codon:yes stop_codon:yes gene_type:complete
MSVLAQIVLVVQCLTGASARPKHPAHSYAMGRVRRAGRFVAGGCLKCREEMIRIKGKVLYGQARIAELE